MADLGISCSTESTTIMEKLDESRVFPQKYYILYITETLKQTKSLYFSKRDDNKKFKFEIIR